MNKLIGATAPVYPTLRAVCGDGRARTPGDLPEDVPELPVLAVLLIIKGENPADADGLIELALIPTAWALLALVTPFGGGWWAQNLGGREPSERERIAYGTRSNCCCHATVRCGSRGSGL